jgi:hypothetical protein
MSDKPDEKDVYDKILAKPITVDYNEIDKAKELLSELLDDEDQLIGDNVGAVIQCAIDLLE